MASLSQIASSLVLRTADILIGRVKITDGTDVALVTSGGDLNTTVNTIIPGTSATHLGKAISSAVGGTDTGVMVLGVHDAEASKIAVSEEDYDHLHIGELGGLSVEPEQHNHLDEMDATSGWAVFGNDTINFNTTTNHLTGSNALTFDKTNGAAGTVFAGIEKTITTVDMGELDLHDIIQTVCFVSSVSLIDYVFVRIGTSSSNYNEWRVDGDDITAGEFTILGLNIGAAKQTGNTGNGVDWGAIAYIAVGVAFDGASNTLSGIIFDQLGIFTGSHTTAAIATEVTSTVNTANINLQKVGGSPTSKGAGAVGNGSQRIVIGDVTAANDALQATGDEANDAPDAGNPLKIGGRAQASFAIAEQASADNDRVDATFDRAGYQRVRGELHPQSAVISDALSGDNEIIAAPGSNLRLAIYAYTMIADGTVLARWESGASGTALSGRMSFQAREGAGHDPGSMPLFVCLANQALNLELSAAVAMQGHVTYAIWNSA